MIVPLRASRAVLAATGPLVLPQGRVVRRTTPRLPEAAGPTTVTAGAGARPLRLLLLGDSTVAGIGVASHEEGLAGGLARELAPRLGRPVAATAIGRGGATSRDLVVDLLDAAAGPWDAAFVSIGANDALAARSRRTFARDLGTVLDRLESDSPGIALLVSSLPGFRWFELLPQPLRWNLDLHARSLEAAARAAIAGRAWMTPPASGYTPDFFAADRFHPGAVGYARWAAWIADAAEADGVLARLRSPR